MATKENDYEMYFRWYCEELKTAGFLKDFSREPETFTILSDAVHQRTKHFASKENTQEDFNLLSGITYTYDFRLIWDKRAEYILYETFFPSTPFIFGRPTFVAHELSINNQTEIVSYVDVKPHARAATHGGNVSTYYTFPFIQKIAFHLYKLYFNKIVPVHTGKQGWKTCLFSTTFVPNRYMFTNKSGDLRKIPYAKRPLNSFVQHRQAYIKKYMKPEQTKLL